MITLVLADDHPLFLDGVRGLVQGEPDLNVLAVASNGALALRLIEQHRPDIAVLDVSMPELTGIEVASHLRTLSTGTHVIILSVFEDRINIRKAIDGGARGYVLKRSSADNLVHAIRAVSQGGLYIDPIVARLMLLASTEVSSPELWADRDDTISLTSREVEVLRSFARGYTIKEVAAQLGITIKSVETYKTRASEKLQLGSRAKIVRFAMRQGWFDDAHG